MARRLPPPAPTEPADGRSCDAGHCDAPSIGWRWFSDVKQWLPCCVRHMSAKGVPREFRRYDPPSLSPEAQGATEGGEA